MDLRERLSTEHSRALTVAIVKFIGADQNKFKKLLTLFFGPDKVLAQRAAWAFSDVAMEHPHLVVPLIGRLIEKLKSTGHHNAVERNILRALQNVDVPEEYEAVLVDHCFARIRDQSQAVAIRAFAITLAALICKKYPELASEMLYLLREIMVVPQTPAIQVRVRRAIKDLSGG